MNWTEEAPSAGNSTLDYEDPFSGLFEAKASKIFFVAFSCASTPLTVALLYSSKPANTNSRIANFWFHPYSHTETTHQILLFDS